MTDLLENFAITEKSSKEYYVKFLIEGQIQILNSFLSFLK